VNRIIHKPETLFQTLPLDADRLASSVRCSRRQRIFRLALTPSSSAGMTEYRRDHFGLNLHAMNDGITP
jgi:hypothetical protein